MRSALASERIDRARAVARDAGVDYVLLGLPENLYYFSGFRTMLYSRQTFVCIPACTAVDPVLIAPTVDRRLINEGIWTECFIEDIRFWGPEGSADVYPSHVAALSELITEGASVGIDGIRYDWASGLAADLKPAGGFVPISGAIDATRMKKDDTEIARIREANELAFEVLDEFVPRMIRDSESITEVELASEIERHVRNRGADGFACPVLVSHGDKMMAPHSPPLPRPIGPGIPTRVVLDCTIDGYTSDIIRTYILGDAPRELQQREDAFLRAQSQCFAVLRPGVSGRDLLETVRGVYEEEGVLSLWGRNIGHGLGLTIHEPPRIAGGDETILQSGTVLAVEPVLAGIEGMGTYAQCDCCVITDDGCEVFTPHDQGLYRL